MSKQPPKEPLRLAEKLLQIRKSLGLSQTAVLSKMGLEDRLFRSNISQYELGSRTPSLIVTLFYAKLANIYVDVLIDDNLDLPEELPSKETSPGISKKK